MLCGAFVRVACESGTPLPQSFLIKKIAVKQLENRMFFQLRPSRNFIDKTVMTTG